jgi:hypothetical protein
LLDVTHHAALDLTGLITVVNVAANATLVYSTNLPELTNINGSIGRYISALDLSDRALIQRILVSSETAS